MMTSLDMKECKLDCSINLQWKTILLVYLAVTVAAQRVAPVDWNAEAQHTLQAALKNTPITGRAKNIILFLGDGMGVSTVTAARILKGQLQGQSGEEGSLSFDEFPNVALSKTYNVDFQVPDSSATATAFLCGVKAQMGTAGVSQDVQRGRCEQVKGNEVTSMARWAQVEGKATGIVTSTRITHATPAASYSHTAERNWEAGFGEASADAQRHGCADIATQLVHGETGKHLNVILGGGRGPMMSINTTDPEYPELYGIRKDGKELILEWLNMKKEQGKEAEYVWNKDQFDKIDVSETDYLMGLFEPSHMQYDIERDQDAEPSLEEMTEKALQMLQKDKDGFFLLVEGGRIDHGHHYSLAKKSLTEVLAMDRAVEKALQMTDVQDTLIVVTADHSHVFTMAGYPQRGNPIFGLTNSLIGKDGLPFTTLGYANGAAGLYPGESRANLTGVDTEDKDFLFPSLVPLKHETHGGEDVAIYASGPQAHLFHGVHEQNYIAHVMGYAACIGQNRKLCARAAAARTGSGNGRASIESVIRLVLYVWLAGVVFVR